MSVFIVRRASTKGLIGIFAVSQLSDLASHIGDCAAPAECEYAEIDSGGIIWPAVGGRKIPAEVGGEQAQIDEAEDQEDPDPMKFLAGAVLSYSWQEAFYEAAHSWQMVPAAADDTTDV